MYRYVVHIECACGEHIFFTLGAAPSMPRSLASEVLPGICTYVSEYRCVPMHMCVCVYGMVEAAHMNTDIWSDCVVLEHVAHISLHDVTSFP